MTKQLIAAAITIIVLALATGSDVQCQMLLNPYTPMNAVAAETLEPYNLWEIPYVSIPYYHPCPTCGPAAAGLPDVFPPPQYVKGFLGLPMPVP